MRNNIATDGFLRIRIKHRTGPTIDLRNHLIRNNNRNTEFIRKALQRAHEFRQMRLPRTQFPPPAEIGSVEGRSAIDDEEREPRLAHHRAGLVQEL